MKNQANQSQNKSFKPTPIPHRTKSGEPMAYYILSEDGAQEFKVPRAECLARSEEPEKPFPQRWYVDEESGLVVRLPRNQMGEDLARENIALYGESKNIKSGNFNAYGKEQASVTKNVRLVSPARAALLNLISHWVTILTARIHFTNLPIPLISQNF